MENQELFEKSIKRVAVDFLNFYGLVTKDSIGKKWNPDKTVLQNIDAVLNSHDCGLAALGMGIKLFASVPELQSGIFTVCNNKNHWYLSYWDGRLGNPEVFWDTSVAFGKYAEVESDMRGYTTADKLDNAHFEDAIADILNNDAYGQHILFQWLYLSFPNVNIEVTGLVYKDLIRLLRKLLKEPAFLADARNFPAEDNQECIFGAAHLANKVCI